MYMKNLLPYLAFLIFLTTIFGFNRQNIVSNAQSNPSDTLHYPEEKNFRNIRQLTFGADNAEAYWSFDDKYVVFQRTAPAQGIPCDQIFIGRIPQKPEEKFDYKMVS